MPWTAVVAYAIRDRLINTRIRSATDTYLAVWAAVVIVLFLPSQAKIITYLLPAFPALLAVAAAWVADRLERGSRLPTSMYVLAATWTTIAAAALAGAGIYTVAIGYSSWAWFVLAAIAAALVWTMKLRRSTTSTLWAPALATTLILLGAAGPGTVVLEQTNSLVAPSQIIVAEGVPHDRVFAYRRSSHAVGFYAHSAVNKVLWAGDLAPPLVTPAKAAIITKERHLLLLGLAPLPPDTKVRWRNRRGDILLIKGASPSFPPPNTYSVRQAQALSWRPGLVAGVFFTLLGCFAAIGRATSRVSPELLH